MATENKPKSNTNDINNKKRKRFLPHNKPVKKKGSYPLRPGVQGFFITCDGGREHQASREAINVIDSFYEELVHRKDTNVKLAELSSKPLNKKIRFTYSDDDENDNDGEDDEEEEDNDDGADGNKSNTCKSNNVENETSTDDKLSSPKAENTCGGDQMEKNNQEDGCKDDENQANEADEQSTKKNCIETCALKCVVQQKVEEKSIDKLIEEELKELGDKNKRRFLSLDSGCNGVVFVQMRKIEGDPSPKDIVQHMMTSAAATRKHMSRFILRVLPVEVACYASEEEISRAIAPLVEKYFPVDKPQKFAVLYEARANSGIDRMKIINSVAKSVPGPHKVDLSNPDKTIVVEIAKTLCLIGVVEKYKELSKYNLRQLTSSKQ